MELLDIKLISHSLLLSTPSMMSQLNTQTLDWGGLLTRRKGLLATQMRSCPSRWFKRSLYAAHAMVSASPDWPCWPWARWASREGLPATFELSWPPWWDFRCQRRHRRRRSTSEQRWIRPWRNGRQLNWTWTQSYIKISALIYWVLEWSYFDRLKMVTWLEQQIRTLEFQV